MYKNVNKLSVYGTLKNEKYMLAIKNTLKAGAYLRKYIENSIKCV